MVWCWCVDSFGHIIAAFLCVATGKPFYIPVKINMKCVKSAEAIVNNSYSHAEVFTSVLIIIFSEKSIRCVIFFQYWKSIRCVRTYSNKYCIFHRLY